MSSQALRSILSRWECSPPAIGTAEANGEFRHVFPMLRKRSIVRPITPAASIECSDCGELRRINYVNAAGGDCHGFISCSQCGSLEVPAGLLERWEIHSDAFLAASFHGTKLSVHEHLPGQLWQVGKANWAGRTREIWFARSCRVDAVDAAVTVLARRPKALLFVPTEVAIGYWQVEVSNLVISLEQALTILDSAFHLDVGYVEGKIIDAGMGPDAVSTVRTKRRASRVTNIELLKNTLIEHLLAARDHAFETQERTGQPQLLPRPSRKELGDFTGLKSYQVTKCFQDKGAAELNLYLETANDLDQIMKWKGRLKRGRGS